MIPTPTFRTDQNPRLPERPSTRESKHEQALDIALGFAILLTVLGHSLDSLYSSGTLPSESPSQSLIVFVINLFQMPLFFFVSGNRASGTRRSAFSTFGRLLPSLVYPYFLWSVLKSLAPLLFSGYTAIETSLLSLYKILWIPVFPFWLLYALFFCQIAYLLIRRRSYLLQIILAAILFISPQFFLGPIRDSDLQILLETAHGFLYFVLGAVSVAQVRQFSRWVAIPATVLFALFAIFDYQSQFAGPIAAPAALPAGIAGVIATLAWSRMIASRDNWLTRGIAFCGRYWISIYLMHIFVITGMRFALEQFTLPLAAAIFPVFIVTASTALGIALPLGFNWLTSKFELDKWFGLPHIEMP